MDWLHRPGWYERIKTGPSPEDDALLRLTREVSAQLRIPYWYKQIFWGRFNHYDSIGWMISKPAIPSREVFTVPGSLPQAELMIPEYLKGKLSLDEWKILISMHLLRIKAYDSGRMSKLLGKIALAPRSLFFLLLFYIPAAAAGGLSGPVIVLPSPIFLLSALWIRRSLRKSLKRREFELDRDVANHLGTEQVSRVLERMQNLEPRIIPRFPLLAHWNPSIIERIRELNNPASASLPRPSRTPKIGLRGRVIIVLVGFGIFWGSGFIAGNLYAQGRATFTCADNTCAALVVIAAVGFWTAIIGVISIVAWTLRRFL